MKIRNQISAFTCAAAFGIAMGLPALASAEMTPASPPAEAAPVATDAPAAPAAPTEVAATPAPAEQPGKVIFFRMSKLQGAALSFSIREDGKGVCKLTNGSYCELDVAPGLHVYQLEGEVTDTLRLEVEPGETYYVQQAIGMGIMMARPNMTPSDKTTFESKSLKLSTKKPTDK